MNKTASRPDYEHKTSMKRIILLAFVILHSLFACAADSTPKADPRYPFRTDFANEALLWYQLKPGEFPPHHSDHRVGGELVEVDFIHRSGVFRMNRTGELVHFTMPPFGSVYYLNAEADLRDVPLGTYFLFFLHQDENGAFTKLATMQDQFTMDAGHGFTYRLDEAKLGEGKLLVTKRSVPKNQPDLGKSELLVNDSTRVWKNDKQIKLGDLAAGDELLYSRTGVTATKPSVCIDIWVGVDTHKLATEQERKKHTMFLKERGLPAWIESVEGKKVTVTLFGADRASLQGLFKDEGIDPVQLAKEHRVIQACVADEHLRTYNPPVDKQKSTVLEVQKVPTECYGCGGERWIIEPDLLLEGFRKGHILRLFVQPSWTIKDMPFGEGVYTEIPDAETRDPSPNQYPFRTDFANKALPWYQPKPGEFPPYLSEHRVGGELVKVDAAHRSGQFLMDGSGELVSFTMLPYGTFMHLNAETAMEDVPLGTRYFFYLHPDEKGAFIKASLITDEFTYMASNKVLYRVTSSQPGEGRLLVALQIALVKNYNGDMVKPPDIGANDFTLDDKTRVWKGDQLVKLGDLALDDELLLNTNGRTTMSRGRVTDLWIGTETQQLATEKQRKKSEAFVKEHGAAAMIDSVEGKKITFIFFSGSRTDFIAPLSGDPKGKSVYIALTDEYLHSTGTDLDKIKVITRQPEISTAGTYGCSGVRWEMDAATLPAGYRQGSFVRVFAEKPGGNVSAK